MRLGSTDRATVLRGARCRAAGWAMGLALALPLCLAPAGPAAGEPAAQEAPIVVDQVTDPRAGDVFMMFRFKPALVRVPVGRKVRILNSRGQHTVVSIKKMWPAGVPVVNLSNLDAADLRFNRPGLYGFTCKVHGRYGMVMLLAVGESWPNLEAARAGMPGGRAGARMRQLFAELEGGN